MDGNRLFIQTAWTSLLDRSMGWETSNGAGRGVGKGGWQGEDYGY